MVQKRCKNKASEGAAPQASGNRSGLQLRNKSLAQFLASNVITTLFKKQKLFYKCFFFNMLTKALDLVDECIWG